MGRFQRKIRAQSRWQILATILVGIACAPAMVVLSPSAGGAATSGLSTTAQAPNANPVGDLIGYVETLPDVGLVTGAACLVIEIVTTGNVLPPYPPPGSYCLEG